MRCALTGLSPSSMSPAEPSSSVRREKGLQQQCSLEGRGNIKGARCVFRF